MPEPENPAPAEPTRILRAPATKMVRLPADTGSPAADRPPADREAIRKRPGMYIGSTGPSGTRQLVWELASNSLDQVIAGRASRVEIVLHDDDSIEVIDDGPGINLLDEAVYSYFVELHDQPTADSHWPHIHISSLSCGVVVANFLSSRFEVTTRFANETIRCAWTEGGEGGGTPEIVDQDWVGTSVRMWLDPSIFDAPLVEPGSLDERVFELKSLIPGLFMTVNDQRPTRSSHDGLLRLLRRRHGERQPLGEPSFASQLDDRDPASPVEFRLCCAATSPHYVDESITAFCNYREITDAGAFARAVRAGFWRVAANTLGTAPHPDPETPIRGLAIVIDVTMLAPSWGGPTRSRLDDPRALAAVERFMTEQLPGLIEESDSLRSLFAAALEGTRETQPD